MAEPANSRRRRGDRSRLLDVVTERERREREARALQHDERFDPVRRLPVRRALVVMGYLLAVAAGTAAWSDPQFWLGGSIAPFLLLAGVTVALGLHRALRHAVDAPEAVLDARTVAVRDRAHRHAYLSITWTTIAVFAVLIAVGGVEQHHLVAVAMTYAVGAILTPMAFMAWTQEEV